MLNAEPADGLAVRDALESAGIRGPNLDLLAASPNLTAEVVQRAGKAIHADPNVRNAPAVLARRLADRAGVTLKKSARLPPAMNSAVGRIEALRRTKGADRGKPCTLAEVVDESVEVAIVNRQRTG